MRVGPAALTKQEGICEAFAIEQRRRHELSAAKPTLLSASAEDLGHLIKGLLFAVMRSREQSDRERAELAAAVAARNCAPTASLATTAA